MIAVKICGVNSVSSLAAAADAGAEWVGYNFYAPSPRAVTPARAAELSASYPDGPERVGLFVEPTDEEIAAVLDAVALSALQIYAPADRTQALRTRFGVPVWQVFAIGATDTLPQQVTCVDRLLLEAKAPEGAALPGGNGLRFDWNRLRSWTAPAPWLLAGGLTPENVQTAIAQSGAQAVDVSSGVESARGVKDPALIRAFIAAAKGR